MKLPEECYSVINAAFDLTNFGDAQSYEQTEFAKAKVFATIRMARGGVRRIVLASWKGEEAIDSFFNRVKDAWEQLPKEADDRTQHIPNEMVFEEDK